MFMQQDEAGTLVDLVGLRSAPENVRSALTRAILSVKPSSEDFAVLEDLLLVGNWRAVELISVLEIGAVLNCALKVETPTEPPSSCVFHRLSMPDAPHPRLDVILPRYLPEFGFFFFFFVVLTFGIY